ncbi:hypothetical protein EDC04DRAFT_2709052 [Pisolithus marmoratus]|nr:hypothetical protein EDC04DRAFT_2709052 [Pisolithus marmoratus]
MPDPGKRNIVVQSDCSRRRYCLHFAQCESLDMRPEVNQLFLGFVLYLLVTFNTRVVTFSIDYDAFLPSTVRRYHQLVMPTLKLIMAMLALPGVKHGTTSHQVSSSYGIFDEPPRYHHYTQE